MIPAINSPAVCRARAKSALCGLSCGYGGQWPASGLLSHRCALHLDGEHSTPAQVRATWRRSVEATAQIRHRIAASPRRHPSRSTACLRTLHEPWHKQHRGFAIRYDKLAVRYDATVQITNINIWLRNLSNRA